MTDAEILHDLTMIFRHVFKRPGLELTAASNANTIDGWDSFKYVEIIVEIETTYSIEIDELALDNVACVGDLMRLIGAATRSRPPA